MPLPRSRGVSGSAEDDEEAEAEVEGVEKFSLDDEERSDEGRASLSRSELRWERSRPALVDLAEEWKADPEGRAGVA